MGYNNKGQLGCGPHSKQVGTPTLVESLKHLVVTQVCCGYDTTCCLTQVDAKPKVWSWGANKFGQLGHQSCKAIWQPEHVEVLDQLDADIVQLSCGDQHTLFLSRDGEVIATGNNSNGQCGFNTKELQGTDQPYKLMNLQSHKVVQVAAGFQHSLFLTNLGKCLRTNC